VTLFVAFLVSVVVFSATALAERAATPSPAIVKVAFNKKLKTSILVDGRGLTLYLYTIDRPGKPRCYNTPFYLCAKAFPPLRTKGAPRAGQGVKASLLGVAKRTDGGVQVMYNRHPLHTNAGFKPLGLIRDKRPGDVYGQNFEGTFFVVSPRGTPILRK
jgi:predicted lipoprotein with Yx(FWY)xxD motif